uniref:Solute carrier organic anion transporter family member n=1 Tax=Saccoglossus kowalevskii TaxID=10224 RepID=A0ABM0MID1_SACKO|nr:PREDICTED: solute carrier organic anion transporter family member 4C1-like [Saccoglossus kowalevskii]
MDETSLDERSATSQENATTAITNEEEAADDAPLLCGWFMFRPNSFQKVNTISWLVTIMSLLCFAQGMVVSGLIPVALTSIEERFFLTSTQLGIIVAMYDFTVMVVILFVSYILAEKNKPRWFGVFTVVLAIGTCMWTLPHFLSPPYDPTGAEEGYYPLCRRSSNVTEDCDDEWDSLSNFFYVFILAQICIGIGASPIYTVGYAWVDENTTHAKSGWYMGILNTMAVLGPATGFIVGALTLTLFTELTVDTGLDSSDDGWIGAWWLGFVFAAILIFILVIPISAFTPVLPGTKYIKDERRSQAHADGSDLVAQQQGFGRTWRDFWPASKLLLKNYPYMWINCARTTSTLVLSGYTPFTPKFIQNQFGLTAGSAGLLVGVISIPGAAGGTLLGGWIVKKTNYGVKGNLKLCIAISIATIVLSLSYFLRCPDQPIAGVFRSYDPTNTTRLSEVQLDHPCNADCNCFRRVYVPVCSEINGLQYFDGCYAGCELTPDALVSSRRIQ